MTDVLVPGGRDVRGSLEPADGADAIVVACPPHPRQGGSRRDSRLLALEAALQERSIGALRFDYGAWDEGNGEREDVRNTVRWASERHDRVGLFGYSFGASLALLAAGDVDGIAAVSALAPTARIGDDLDAVAALGALEVPVQIVYGERDTTAEWEPVVEAADVRELDSRIEAFPADHFFVGNEVDVAERVGSFFEETL
ncbi:alpha/beta hydrolase [Natrarchaeobius halalkaliphilus]|uniref:Alpha/beta hydrolase n=1 Tax=Natrarchaeobius halalkaliphilus TaxID=1679091 RepID=A0A3N6NWA4_9EURY|nr:dienelactone hydrolase family protein [Natrarchaeobius halalkaliphilus]RQG88799.1 alpha/beta hydrolase [Natrarchaeobius halalkaliphilus]